VALMGCVINKDAPLEWRAPSKDEDVDLERGHCSLHRMRPDFPQSVAQVPGRERGRRWPIAVRPKRRCHDRLIDGIQQFTRTLEILRLDLLEYLGQHIGLVRRRQTLPGVDTIYGRVEAPINALDKEIIFHG
jgi:hypothetical protein